VFTYIFTNTFLPGVLLAFACQLCNFIFGSYVGDWVSKTQNRLRGNKALGLTKQSVVKVCLISQNTSVCICGILQLFLFQFDGNMVPWRNSLFLLLFLLLLIIASFGSVTSMARDIAINRDWVVVLAKNQSKKLSGI
jgi:hypothetical protein